MQYLRYVSDTIGIVGVAIIIVGVFGALVRFVRAESTLAFGRAVPSERVRVRHELGYYLLLGLEFLIAADVIDTLQEPGPQELLALGAIVAIRTVISYSLNSELRHDSRPVGAG